MKKYVISVILACTLMSQAVFAQSTDTSSETAVNLYQQYTQTLPDKASTNELLTLDTAMEKAVKNSSTSKTLANSLDLIEKQQEYYGELYGIGSNSYGSLVSLLNSTNSYQSTEISKKVTEEQVKYSTKQTYISIITTQRSIAVQEAALQIEQMNLTVARKKNSIGLLSDEDLKQQKLNYEKAEENLKNTKEQLELSYKALNVLMGVDTENRYSFEAPVTYETLNLDTSIETYINTKVSLAASVKTSQLDLKSAQDSYNIRGLNNSVETYSTQTLQNNVSSASLSLADQKNSVKETMRSLYNTIKTEESSIELSQKELEKLKETYSIAVKKYNLGTISNIELMQAKQDVTEKENSILSDMYTHMLNVEKFNNMNLF